MWNRAVGNLVLKDRFQHLCGVVAIRASSSAVPQSDPDGVLRPIVRKNDKEQKISRAMKSYLARAANTEKFLAGKREEFELGKRHLANIMGWNPDEISQEDIDEAIAYLLPSGLFEPRARPMMKPPEVLFPRERLVEFDVTGRPHNALFYTTKGNFYSHLHDAVSHMLRLDAHRSEQRAKGVRIPQSSEQFDLTSYNWISKERLAEMCMERITDVNYDYFVKTMERLAAHPYSQSAENFLKKFLIVKQTKSNQEMILPLMHDEAGNPYMEAEGRRKTARAIVRVTANGTGKSRINKTRTVVEYFKDLKDRLQVMYPLQFVGLLNKVDIEATIYYRKDEYHLGMIAKNTPEEQEKLIKPLDLRKGLSCEAGAIRHGLAKALCSFVTEEDVNLMRLSGLLQRDVRMRERKKPGQRGARRKYPWRKR